MRVLKLESDLQVVDNRISEIVDTRTSAISKKIPVQYVEELQVLLSDPSFVDFCKEAVSATLTRDIDAEKLLEVIEILDTIKESLVNIKGKVDVEQFFLDGYDVDIVELEETFKRDKLKEKFPNLNLKRLRELYKRPPTTLKVLHSNENMLVDSFVFRKFCVVFIQMIFNEMDFLGVYVGGEGTGKSLKVTQDMFMSYYILSEIGIIDYKFEIKDMLFNNLTTFIETEDRYFDDKFRIIGLDEGNQLHRQNWKDEEVITFFQRLRRERYNQRIKFICLPVLGELITNIVMSRVNFIFETLSKNKVKSGMLKKGSCKMYIIPRAEKIYSPKQKRELSKDEIKQTLYENLKDKSYLTGIPRSLVIHEFTFNNVWGFEREKYIAELKKTNETFSVGNGISIKGMELFMLYKMNITMKKLGIKSGDIRYPSGFKFLNNLRAHFEKNPPLLLKNEAIYNRKLEQKASGEEGNIAEE